MVAELAHPRHRGTVLGFFNTFWYVGAIVAAWGSFGSGNLSASWFWRIPSTIQGVAPFFFDRHAAIHARIPKIFARERQI
jgi:hypothetical protein